MINAIEVMFFFFFPKILYHWHLVDRVRMCIDGFEGEMSKKCG